MRLVPKPALVYYQTQINYYSVRHIIIFWKCGSTRRVFLSTSLKVDPACYTDVGISCENVSYYPIGDISFDMVSLGVPFSCSKLLIDSDLTLKRTWEDDLKSWCDSAPQHTEIVAIYCQHVEVSHDIITFNKTDNCQQVFRKCQWITVIACSWYKILVTAPHRLSIYPTLQNLYWRFCWLIPAVLTWYKTNIVMTILYIHYFDAIPLLFTCYRIL